MPAKDATAAELLPVLANIKILKPLRDLPCGYVGQTGRVHRIHEDGSLQCILRCGHALSVAEIDIDVVVAVDWLQPQEQTIAASTACVECCEEETMKQNKIPNAGGVIQVQGYEDDVKAFVTDYTFQSQLQKRLDDVKDKFRKLAQQASESAQGADVTRVEFIAEDGSCVPVSFADVEKSSNRTAISDKAFKAALKLGFDINEMGITQTDESIVLTGDWVSWFKGVLQSYEAQGQPAPQGYTCKEVVRLSPDGVAKLRKMTREGKTKEERKAAALLLDSGIKAASVSVKK